MRLVLCFFVLSGLALQAHASSYRCDAGIVMEKQFNIDVTLGPATGLGKHEATVQLGDELNPHCFFRQVKESEGKGKGMVLVTCWPFPGEYSAGMTYLLGGSPATFQAVDAALNPLWEKALSCQQIR